MPLALLLAERDQTVRGAILDAFNRSGFEVATARDWEDYLSQGREDNPAVLVCPVSVPGFSGIEACRAAKRDAASDPPFAVLYCAAPQSQEFSDAVRKLGADGLVFLDRDMAAFSEELRQALEGHNPREARAQIGGGEELVASLSKMLGCCAEHRMKQFSAADRDEAILKISGLVQRETVPEDLVPGILDQVLAFTRSSAGWIIIRKDSASQDFIFATRPDNLNRDALLLALSLVQRPLTVEKGYCSIEENPLSGMGYERMMVYPLSQGTIGWLGVADGVEPYGHDHGVFLENIVALLSLHYRNAMALQHARAAMDESKALFKAATLILPYEEPQVVARQVAQTVASILGYKNCAVLLPSEDGSTLEVIGTSGRLERIRATLPTGGSGISVQAFRTGRMVYCPDTSQSPSYIQGWENCLSELSLPLVHRTEVQGVLDVESEKKHAFQGKDLRVLEAFSQRVGTLLYSAKQYQKLSINKERYEKLCDGSPMGLFTWNMNTGRIEEASAVMRSWVGEGVEGKLVESILSPQSKEIWQSWSAASEKQHEPLAAAISLAGSGEIPPVECKITAYPGRGRLRLPGHAVLVSSAPKPHDDSALPTDPHSPPPTRIVLADPDPIWSSVTRLMLEDWGHTVESAGDFQSISGIIGKGGQKVGLLIVDLSLMAGASDAMMRDLRSEFPSLPVLVIGASSWEDAQGRPTGHISKPYRMKELRTALNGLLSL